MNLKETKALLEDRYLRYAQPDFIPTDPIQIPHRFSDAQDIAIAAFLTATIAWGQRVSIIKNATRMIELMDDAPFDFVVNHKPKDRLRFKGFVHRTFSEVDAMYFMEALQRIYQKHGSLEEAFRSDRSGAYAAITAFRARFFDFDHLARTQKHVSNPEKKSSAKRLNMYLRWMVRPATEGIDFGLWKVLSPAELIVPLDVHTSTVARKLGLLKRKYDDRLAAEELMYRLRKFDPEDPVKYDFALFGIGAFEKL